VKVLSQPPVLKTLTAGRVVILDRLEQQANVLGVVVQGPVLSSREKTLKLLVLCDEAPQPPNKAPSTVPDPAAARVEDTFEMPRPVMACSLFRPAGKCGHDVISVNIEQLSVISSKMLKVNADKILADYTKRQSFKFRLSSFNDSMILILKDRSPYLKI